jgi:acyl-CoA thioester hydrolase
MDGQAQEPTGGWFEGRTHVFPVRVYYEDTDFSGVTITRIICASWSGAVSEFLRISGVGHQGSFAASEPLVWAVRRMNVDFDRPARMEEALGPHQRAGAYWRSHAPRPKDRARGRYPGEGDGRSVRHHLDGRPRRVPDSIRKKLEIFLETR